MSSQLTTQEKFNRLNLNLKSKKIDADTLRALIVTNDAFDFNELSTWIESVFVFSDDIIEKDIDYEKIIEWAITKSSDNQINELFNELEDQYGEFLNKQTYFWEKTSYFEEILLGANAHPEEIPYIIKSYFSRFGNDKPIKDEWKIVHFSEIRQISDQMVILHKYLSNNDYLFDFNGRFLNEKLTNCIENEDNSFGADDMSIALGDSNLVLLSAEVGGDQTFYIVEWTGNGFKFIEKLEEDEEIPETFLNGIYSKVDEITKLYSELPEESFD